MKTPLRALLAGAFSLAACAGDGPREPVETASPPASARPPKPLAYILGEGEVRALASMYQDALESDGGKPGGAGVAAFVDEHAGSLNRTCLEGAPTPSARADLYDLVTRIPDARFTACFGKILNEYTPGANDVAVERSLRAVATSSMRPLAATVMKVFATVAFATPKGRLVGLAAAEAMEAVAGPEQEPELLKILEAPLDPASDVASTEGYRQLVAARVLGARRRPAAVEPLFKALLSRSKAQLTSTVLLALARIGPPSREVAAKLLTGKHPELAAYVANASKEDKSGVVPEIVSVNVLSALGDRKSARVLLDARTSAKPVVKVQIARALPTMPRSAETVEAFKAIFDETPLEVSVGDEPAKAVLATSAAGFYDASIVAWLLDSVAGLKGAGPRVDAVRQAALVSAAKLMQDVHVDGVQKLADTKAKKGRIGAAFAAELEQAKELLSACKGGLACYFDRLGAAAKEGSVAFATTKAAFMIGAIGDAAARAKLVEILPTIRVDAARFAALGALVALAPEGDTAAADKLEAAFAAAIASNDQDRIVSTSVFPQIALKLRARAQS